MKKQILAMNLDFLLEIVTATALIFVARQHDMVHYFEPSSQLKRQIAKVEIES